MELVALQGGITDASKGPEPEVSTGEANLHAKKLL